MPQSAQCPNVVLRNGAYYCKTAEAHSAAQQQRITTLETALRVAGEGLRQRDKRIATLHRIVNRLHTHGALTTPRP